MFGRVLGVLTSPGAKTAVHGVAPTQTVPAKIAISDEEAHSDTAVFEARKPRLLDRLLDNIVHASGSEVVFFSILAGLVTWALMGIRFGRDEMWQVIISDVQAILSYAFDSLLVRQQMNTYDLEIMVAAQMQSRNHSHVRMLSKVRGQLSTEEQAALANPCKHGPPITDEVESQLPSEGKFGIFITATAHILGHIVTVGLFWLAVFTWIGIGHMSHYSNTWQLYMNSASSALMVFIFSFLANIRERHGAYSKKCLNALFQADSSLEFRLRSLTGDVENNKEVIIPAPNVNRLQRAIFYYADFVGTLMGVAILITVMIAWVATGPVFHFSSNWWLFIGTYAGLVGMNDGFVLRNMQSRLRSYVDKEMDVLHQQDEQLFQISGLSFPTLASRGTGSITERVSVVVDRVSAHELTVAMGFLAILGLIAGASAMKWTLTGQLLCNVPPSLIESFFMMMLITGHNLIDDRKRAELRVLFERRLMLLNYVETVKQSRVQPNSTLEDKEAVLDSTFLGTVHRD